MEEIKHLLDFMEKLFVLTKYEIQRIPAPYNA